MKQKTADRIISFALTFTLVMTLVPTSAFAEILDDVSGDKTTTSDVVVVDTPQEDGDAVTDVPEPQGDAAAATEEPVVSAPVPEEQSLELTADLVGAAEEPTNEEPVEEIDIVSENPFRDYWDETNQRYNLVDGTYTLTNDVTLQGPLYVSDLKKVTIDLNGNTIRRDLAEPDSYGSVIINTGTLTVKNGYITGGNAKKGGGIYNDSTYSIMDLWHATATLTLQNVAITGNYADQLGGGIYNGTYGDVTLKTAVAITDNEAPKSVGGGIYSVGKLTVSGKVIIQDNGATNLFLESEHVLTVDGVLEDGSYIGISADESSYPRNLTSGLATSGNASAGMFTLENAPSGYSAAFAGGELYVKKDPDQVVNSWAELQLAIDNATEGQVLALGRNITATDSDKHLVVSKGKNVVIDLAGFTLNRGLAGKDSKGDVGQVIYVQAGGTLMLRDTGGTGKITGGNANRGGGLYISGTCYVEGGTITGNKTSEYGGGVHVKEGASFTMTYGSITGNTAGGRGGGLDAWGEVTLKNCSITNNVSGAHGGGIYFNCKGGKLWATNVKIDGNTAATYGGAIYLMAGEMTLTRCSVSRNVGVNGGGAYITENTAFYAGSTVFASNKSTNHSGGAIKNLGTCELTLCTFTGNSAFNSGGAIFTEADDGVSTGITLTSCTFTKNSAMDNGGAIMHSSGKLMLDGNNVISDNYAGLRGGGIYVTAIITGTTINSNLKPEYIYDPLVSLEDTPVVFENRSSEAGANVYLEEHATLIAGSLESGANVGITLAKNKGTFTSDFKKNNEGADPSDFFVVDVDGYAVYTDSKGEGMVDYSAWDDLQRQIDEAENGATITLARKYTAGPSEGPLVIPEGKTLTIDLNGYPINRNLSKATDDGCVIQVGKRAKLTIEDTSASGAGKITGGYNTGDGGGISVLFLGELVLEGGFIVGNKADAGAGVCVSGATFTMVGGEISGNQAYLGGGVFVGNGDGTGTFTLEGGTIKNNKAKAQGDGSDGLGGGIYCAGMAYIKGGEISSNTAAANGGALYLNVAYYNGIQTVISGGTITGNAASYGGAIYNRSVLKLTGGTITENEASASGGGIYHDLLASSSLFGGSHLQVEGSPAVFGNEASAGNDIYLAKHVNQGADAYDLYYGGDLTKAIEVTGALSTDANLGVSRDGIIGTFTTGFVSRMGDADPAEYFFSSDGRCEVVVDANGEAQIASGWALLQAQINAAEDGDTITLTRDYTAVAEDVSLKIPANRKLTIDLNGHTIDRGLSWDESVVLKDGSGHTIIVNEGATLTVCDSSKTGDGAITGGKATHGGGVYNKGTLVLESGSVAGNFSSYGGGVYLAAGAELRIEGGSISSNKAGGEREAGDIDGYGGGIFADKGAHVSLTSGSVDENIAYNLGGGVFLNANATLEMADGAIDSNVTLSAGYEQGGGAIFSRGVLDIQGGSLSSNTALGAGGAIDIASYSWEDVAQARISNAVFENNTSSADGGAIYLHAGELYLTDVTIEDNSASSRGGGIYVGDADSNELYLFGAPSIVGNSAAQGANLVLARGKVMNIGEDGLGDAARIDFVAIGTPRAVTLGLNATGDEAIAPFTYNDDGVELLSIQDGELFVGTDADVWVSSWQELQDAFNNAVKDEVIGLAQDIVAEDGDVSLNVKKGKIVTIELAGYTLDRGLAEGKTAGQKGHVIFVENGATLTVRDTAGTGRITGGHANVGGGIDTHGKLYIESGAIINNKTSDDEDGGGGIFVAEEGYLEMTGGLVALNTSAYRAGGIDIWGKAKLSDCTVMGNVSGAHAGGLYFNNESTLTLDNVTIAGNEAATHGGGIYLMDGAIEMNGGLVSLNSAPDGGGVYVTYNTKFVATDTEISYNEATETNGGGITSNVEYNDIGGAKIVLATATVELVDCSLEGNVAHIDGGGLYVPEGKATVTDTEFIGNKALGFGGGIAIAAGKLNLDSGYFSANKASYWGGGLYVGPNAEAVNVKGSLGVTNNYGGGDVYLSKGKVLTVAGSLEGAKIDVVLEKVEGSFTSGYSSYNSGIKPETIFGSDYNYEVYLKSKEAAIRVQFSADDDLNQFVKRGDQINSVVATNPERLLGANWMSGISGERYLNEINMPYTHDSAMKEAYAWYGTSIGSMLGFDVNAQTQYRFIDEQLNDGVRVLDLRLSNFYNHHTFWDELALWSSTAFDLAFMSLNRYGLAAVALVNPLSIAGEYGLSNHCTADDGTNLWLCHGQKAYAGIFWAEDHEGDQLNFKQVLRWAEDFLRQHPDETIVMNFQAEVPDNDPDYQATVYKRLRDHLKDVYATVNPSTGKSYLYQEEGSESPFVQPTHMPQLKDCRGQIVIMEGGGDVHGITLTTGGLKKIADGTSNDVGAETKIEQLNTYFDNVNLRLPTDADTHPGIIMQPDTNSKADSLADILDPDMRPLAIASKVHPEFFGEGKVFDDRTGRYFGWVKMDGATADACRYIYMSNFFDGLEYRTLTVKQSAGADDSETQTYVLLKGTDLTVSDCVFDNPNAEGGNFTGWLAIDEVGNATAYQPGDAFELTENMTFIAQWDNEQNPQALVYEVFQNADGTWSEPTATVGLAELVYAPASYEHFTPSGYSTEFAADEEGRSALAEGGSVVLDGTKNKLYVYYARDSYSLVFYADIAGSEVAKTVEVPYGANLDAYANMTPDAVPEGYVFSGWSLTPKLDGEYCLEDTIPDALKTEEEAAAHPCVIYGFGATDESGTWVSDTMPGGALSLYPVLRPEQDEPVFRTHALVLDGTIGVRFFMELPALEGVDYTESYMEFSVAGRGATTTQDAFDAQETNQTGSYFGFDCNVSSIQMADTITAIFHYTQNGKEKTVAQEYSIAQYVSDFEALSGNYDKATVDMVHALADYGHYAQRHLSNVHGWAIGSDYADMAAYTDFTTDEVDEALEGLAAYAPNADIPDGGDIAKVSLGLDLVSDTTACLYITVKDGAELASASLADGTELVFERMSDGRFAVRVPGIMAHHLADSFDFVLKTTGGTTARIRVAAVSFAQAVLKSDDYTDNEDAQYLAVALWRYWQAADAYAQAHPTR